MRVEFTKMHGVGNDFVVLDAPGGIPWLTADRVRSLADRHTGIGFDQALILERPRRPETSVYYRIFNADGTEVEQCGNGARCVAALVARRHLGDARALAMDSPGGLVHARMEPSGLVSVDMGVPSFDPRSLPFDAPVEAPDHPYSLEVAGRTLQIGAVSMGNPHVVLVVESVDTAPVAELGPLIERHLRFPKRVNAGFMQIVDPAHIRLRVHERGVGETLACGTGTCAAVAVGRVRGLLGPEVLVRMSGGELRVNWEGPGEHIWLTGPAEVSFEGHVEI
jgi:diaminopimelate epimerase